MMKSLVLALAALTVLPQSTSWRASVTSGVTIAESAGALSIRTGPHADLWRVGARPLSGTYTVRATLRKLGGGRHEGYGIIFGGSNLGTDSSRYSYVMVRGDGDLLVKKRDGAATPVVRDWTHYDAIHADDAQGRAENVLEVRVVDPHVVVNGREGQVASAHVIVSVNGQVLVRVPASELFRSGQAGLRIAHQLQVEVRGFDAR